MAQTIWVVRAWRAGERGTSGGTWGYYSEWQANVTADTLRQCGCVVEVTSEES